MVSGALLFGMVACSPLEPILDPEISDFQLTVDTLRTSVRDAQRTIAELQTEIDQQRHEYADVQIARAQLEGSSREAERRLIEARQVIALQREELATARSEREQTRRTGAALQSQLRQLRKQLSKIGKQAKGETSPAAIIAPRAERPEVTDVVFEQEAQSNGGDESAGNLSSPGVVPVETQPLLVATPVSIAIQPGDTLWSLARRYHTSVMHLMALNELPNDRIQVGQTLRLPERSTDVLGYEGMQLGTPN
ncbi:MAG: LysM peptidoglycan-binding domain-containing protein [Nitrospira sp.]|nr:LysM peptidoglycan-binding domain-containing protein [Nitrospira sp.]MDH4370949.1 LysM peptidoglycan-binding domain-containing protein [Nitrospira sp.]MDH5348998.1 LysM peptidoglycan-binding domain-containing protein [Nitrospira sp.]MDH5498347.1 LysM peptidoglycan-binding domain-containing protein [Nitrospira sp.]MDH5725868.1 LysM peptidoglycan-binding domain-containing protein [Nitrospira sp.]